MKVIIVCKEPFPEGMAATERIICYAKALQMGGIDCNVTIFGRTEKAGSGRNTQAKGCHEGISFEYMGGSTIKPSHKIPRLISQRADKLKLKAYLNKHLEQGDIVIGFINADTDFMCGIIDLVHSKRAKYVRELCEIPFFGSSTADAKLGLDKMLKLLFPKCDGFLVISKTLEDVAKANKNKDAKILRVPILVDYESMAIDDRSGETEVPFIFHAGTLFEQKDGIVGMLEAFAKARQESDVDFRLICTGNPCESPDKSKILKVISEQNIGNKVDFLGYCSKDQIRDYLSRASLVVVNKYPNPQNLYCFSTKLGIYLAAGKCIIITDVGEAMNWLEDGRSAWIVPHDDVDAMANAILSALNDRGKRQAIGEAGRMVCKESFDYRSVSHAMCSFMKSL